MREEKEGETSSPQRISHTTGQPEEEISRDGGSREEEGKDVMKRALRVVLNWEDNDISVSLGVSEMDLTVNKSLGMKGRGRELIHVKGSLPKYQHLPHTDLKGNLEKVALYEPLVGKWRTRRCV